MENLSENEALAQYISSLERQLQTKSIQQQTLYRALDAANQELTILDQLYTAKADLLQEVNCLKTQLQTVHNQSIQINEVLAELHRARQQIARLSQLLAERSNLLSLAQDRLEELEEQNQALGAKASSFELNIKQELIQKTLLNQRLLEKNEELGQKTKQIDYLEDKLQALSYNYVKVEQAVREKDCLIRSLRQQVQELEEGLEAFRQQLGQKNIMINCLESELQEAKQTYRSQPQNQLQNLLSSIEKIDLLKQTNYLVERFNYLEIENRGEIPNASHKNKKLKNRLEEVRLQFQALSENLQL